jgi:hypothetical protein
MQAIMGKKGPTLRAESVNCLLIPIYVNKHKVGCLIHLWPDFGLTDEAADLIRRPFEDYPELKENPTVGSVSSDNMRNQYPNQICEVKRLIRSIAPAAVFYDIAMDKAEKMSAGVKVQTDTREFTFTTTSARTRILRMTVFAL